MLARCFLRKLSEIANWKSCVAISQWCFFIPPLWSLFNVQRYFMGDAMPVDSMPFMSHLEAEHGTVFRVQQEYRRFCNVFVMFLLITDTFGKNGIIAGKGKRELVK